VLDMKRSLEILFKYQLKNPYFYDNSDYKWVDGST